ncbi:hypothetical protein C8R43DRAFT_1122734 [Mycena crocata]|nr:hypothetical protein C8R43DRAFT_1122734 [Mycena crocata]
MTTHPHPGPPSEGHPPPVGGHLPREALSNAHGYYTFVPFATASDAGVPTPEPKDITPAHPDNVGVTTPPGLTDPAAIAAVAAANAARSAMPQRPPGYVHVVTGIPPGLAALLRSTGPWTANVLYSVPPTGPLNPVDEIVPAPEWYCVTRGRFVGVFDQYAQAHWAIRGVSNAVQKSYSSQAFALSAFNKVVQWGGVEVA